MSGYLEINSEFGGISETSEKFDGKIRAKRVSKNYNQLNTVIGIVATNANLNRNQLKRLSIMCQGAISRSIHPAHTPMDGDTIFAISTSQSQKEEICKFDLTKINTIASDCFSRACNRAVYEAKSIGFKPSWKDLFNN